MKTIIFLNPNGVDERVLSQIKDTLSSEKIEYELYDEHSDLNTCDFVIAYGGDGTILQAAKQASFYKKAVLGINGGRFGYTAGLETDELQFLKKLKTGEYQIDKRMMLEVTVSSSDKKIHCVNDVVVSRGALSRIVDVSLSIGDNELMNTRSDGVIVSTPTGSTAYSLSAGGPILDPSINSILVTAVCPHSFFDRPIVLNENEIIKIKGNNSDENELYLTVDGEKSIKLSNDDVVTIKKSDVFVASLIRIKQESFMNVLNKKFFNKG